MVCPCNSCRYSNICKYKETCNELMGKIGVVLVPEPFTVEITCKHYYNNCTYLQSSFTQNFCDNATDIAITDYKNNKYAYASTSFGIE